MRTLIIYCSDYKNNTGKIASIFSNKTGSDLINIRDTNDVNLESYDLIGFGSGVYMENLSPKLFKLINVLVSKGAINKGSFACKGSFIAKEFSNNKIFDIMGRLSQGHPNDKDFIKAEKFISRISDLNI